MTKIDYLLVFLNILMLLIAAFVGDLPYAYYILLRWIVFLSCGRIIIYSDLGYSLKVLLILAGWMFNPIFRYGDRSKEWWIILDISVTILWVIVLARCILRFCWWHPFMYLIRLTVLRIIYTVSQLLLLACCIGVLYSVVSMFVNLSNGTSIGRENGILLFCSGWGGILLYSSNKFLKEHIVDVERERGQLK